MPVHFIIDGVHELLWSVCDKHNEGVDFKKRTLLVKKEFFVNLTVNDLKLFV